MTTNFIPFALPDIGEEEIAEVVDTLRSGWITTGPKTKRLEEEFARSVGATHAVAVNSCTAAMHLALEAVGIGPDDEVIVPTTTFAASGEVVRYMGAKPVLVEVNPSDHTIDVNAARRAVTSKTKAIIPVHFAGKACDMDAVRALADEQELVIIEDAAHAFPASYQDKKIGTIGDITCFSFYATKTITTAEGGMALTENAQWADRMRVMALHGISKDAWKRYTAEGSWYYEVVAPGYKYNMTDMAAAMGLVQLGRADEMLARRGAIARRYLDAFANVDAIECLDHGDFGSHAWHLFVIKLLEDKLSIDRSRFIEELKALGIGTSVHFIPLHHHPYYRETFGYSDDQFPVATEVYGRSVSLPIYSKMSDAEMERVISGVIDTVKKNRR